jgi:hypothetical protein
LNLQKIEVGRKSRDKMRVDEEIDRIVIFDQDAEL